MRRYSLPACLLFAGLLAAQCGCPASNHPHTYPDDPLFVSKKPLEVTAAPSAPAGSPSVIAEPQIPPVPAVVRLSVKGQ